MCVESCVTDKDKQTTEWKFDKSVLWPDIKIGDRITVEDHFPGEFVVTRIDDNFVYANPVTIELVKDV